MKQVILIHNPSAGNEEHSREKLVEQIEKGGLSCRYYSTKEQEWKDIDYHADILAIAGGDGTIRKVIKQVLKQKHNIPIGILPLGTANNIAKSLEISGATKQIIRSWKSASIKKIDIGWLYNVPEESFFLEGFGFGIFPYLMKEMKKRDIQYKAPEDELKGALKILYEILLSYEPRKCHLEIDGTDHSGKFYMVEVMNIRSIGPNLVLDPYANPGDGELEVILISEAHKDKFAAYLLQKLANGEDEYQFHTLKGKQIKIRFDGKHLHADDKLLKVEKETDILIEIKEKFLELLVPTGNV
ncbi:diacylglycerol/lipid kinase family protein [Longitalea arenae]|uniref:diacylglycerol/lipid kinase family protein n=1 Tax=Longitalea arenae TaxID=2812558 RepID=UPI0019674D04|nr:diacylglycerol kinase family protein [Longitalea arenae]